MTTEVRDNRETSWFEILVDGEVAGRAEYRRAGGEITFTHTVIEPGHEGQGLGGKLAQGALDAVRASGGDTVVAKCEFMAGWIDKHPDYQDLLVR